VAPSKAEVTYDAAPERFADRRAFKGIDDLPQMARGILKNLLRFELPSQRCERPFGHEAHPAIRVS
jgi:hypothetical protein